jgi:hypothetical protein
MPKSAKILSFLRPNFGNFPNHPLVQLHGASLDVAGRLKCFAVVRFFKGASSDVAADASPIILPQMNTLVFTGNFRFAKWISHLVMPNLLLLQVGDVVPEDTASLTTNPSLTVEIDPNHFTSSSLHELLRAFPTISHLRLSLSTAVFHRHPMSLDDTFLTLFYSPQNFCPALTNFAVFHWIFGRRYPGLCLSTAHGHAHPSPTISGSTGRWRLISCPIFNRLFRTGFESTSSTLMK